ncbi:MAG: 4Fe-4S binding protein [Syntrophobacterales bacterium]|nr:4Fe-4S binding protein [Syntrophobacterales bacterium]
MEKLLYLRDVVTLSLDPIKCTGCGMCLCVCPRRVFLSSDRRVEIAERDACIECGACQRNCPQGAVTVKVGVGCAASVINGMLRRKRASSAADDDSPTPRCC